LSKSAKTNTHKKEFHLEKAEDCSTGFCHNRHLCYDWKSVNQKSDCILLISSKVLSVTKYTKAWKESGYLKEKNFFVVKGIWVPVMSVAQ